MNTNTTGCRYCIDGNLPAGTHPVLGEVYQACPDCLGTCPTCGGKGLYPAGFSCLACCLRHLICLGLVPALCPDCTAVIDLLPLDTPLEVKPHAH